MPDLLESFQEVVIHESIEVERSESDTFAFVTDFNHISQLFDNLTEIKQIENNQISESRLTEGAQYQQTLLVHGNPNHQIVTVIGYETDILYSINTELFGFDVNYTYVFIPVDDSSTWIELTKQATGQGFWKVLRPLLHHLFKAPEHDGEHR